MTIVRKAFSGKRVGSAESGMGRPTQALTRKISAVPGTEASRPTRAMRPATGQRSIGSMRPNQAASAITCSQFRTAEDGEINEPDAQAHVLVGAERPGHAHDEGKADDRRQMVRQ